MQAFYDQTKSVEATFHQTYFHRLYDKYDRSAGTVEFQKPGKMRWDYAAPNGKVIVSNGKRLLDLRAGRGQRARSGLRARHQRVASCRRRSRSSPARASWTNDFTFRLLDAAQQGFAGGYVLELMPKEKSPHYERILFYVDGRGRPRGPRASRAHRRRQPATATASTSRRPKLQPQARRQDVRLAAAQERPQGHALSARAVRDRQARAEPEEILSLAARALAASKQARRASCEGRLVRSLRAIRRRGCGRASWACGLRFLAFGQHDAELEHLGVAAPVDVHLHVVEVDALVLGDHLQQLLLELRQVTGRAVAAGRALARDDDLQAVLGDLGRVLGLLLKNLSQLVMASPRVGVGGCEQAREEAALFGGEEAVRLLLAEEALDDVG